MQNECSECGAVLAPQTTKCVYCGSSRQDEDRELLQDLMEVKREFALADARGDRLAMKRLLADEYIHSESDAGIVVETGKDWFVNEAPGNENFVSYGISKEELLDYTGETATMACVETTIYSQPDWCPNYFWRTKSNFVRRDGSWQLLSEVKVTIDEFGKDVE